jgi:hypothetical protein
MLAWQATDRIPARQGIGAGTHAGQQVAAKTVYGKLDWPVFTAGAILSKT